MVNKEEDRKIHGVRECMCSGTGASHGNPIDYVRKSDTITWLVCTHCKQPIGWLESTKEELMQQPSEEENKKYV